jgi:hypothetical protein
MVLVMSFGCPKYADLQMLYPFETPEEITVFII